MGHVPRDDPPRGDLPGALGLAQGIARARDRVGLLNQHQLEKTNLAAEAAFINYEELDNQPKAIELFQKTLSYDPEHARVGQVLADIYFENSDYHAADPIYDMLGRKVDLLELDPDEQRDLFLRAARVARELHNPDKALKQYKRAYDIDSTNHEVLSGMADLLVREAGLGSRLQALPDDPGAASRHAVGRRHRPRVLPGLGTIKNMQQEPRKALNYFEKALEGEPSPPRDPSRR